MNIPPLDPFESNQFPEIIEELRREFRPWEEARNLEWSEGADNARGQGVNRRDAESGKPARWSRRGFQQIFQGWNQGSPSCGDVLHIVFIKSK